MGKFEVGDVFFVHDINPLNFVSTAIMVCESDQIKPHKNKIPYHVAIVYDSWGKLVEATWGKGVRFNNTDHYINHKTYKTWVKRLDSPLSEESKKMLETWLTDQIGKPYDRLQIFGIFWRSLVRVIPPLYSFLKKRKSYVDSRKKFICSELVYRAYKEVLGINLYPKASAGNVTPFDLDRSQLLKSV